MEKFCVIIPDRGDRPEFLEHCLYQMQRQTVKPDHIYLINDMPKWPGADLIYRIKKGLDQAKEDGFEKCYIIENDDYYPDSYFESMDIYNFDFIGIPMTYYYHLMVKKFSLLFHGGEERSSLFCTGFKISALCEFEWPSYNQIFLDLKLWEYARNHKIRLLANYLLTIPDHLPIGIKHGLGLCLSAGHNKQFNYQNDDSELTWLQKNTRPESFDFYIEMIKKYK